MKIMVDKMPEKAQDCLFSAMGTGKPRCRHDAKLCPLLSGEKCPHLTTPEIPVSEIMNPISEPVVEPVKRTTKRSTAKKSE